MTSLTPNFGKLTQAFSMSAKRWRKLSGAQDPQAAFYNKLTPPFFDYMQEKYGLDATAQYIHKMEAMKARGLDGQKNTP